jgi:hypothetical protein
MGFGIFKKGKRKKRTSEDILDIDPATMNINLDGSRG